MHINFYSRHIKNYTRHIIAFIYLVDYSKNGIRIILIPSISNYRTYSES